MNSFAYYNADVFIQRKMACFELNIPTIIDGITDINFPAVVQKLNEYFGRNNICTILDDEGNATDIKIKDLTYIERLIVKASGFLFRDFYSFGDLLEIIKKLRDPNGCSWDRVQTHASIKNNAIEESYELAEAIDLDITEKIIEESGDVMLQGLFHAAIAEDSGRFTTSDIINALCVKLVTRHPHVFGDNEASGEEEALKSWDMAKAKEKSQTSLADKISSVPVTFGALMRAYKVQKIIKKTGFDFANAEDAKLKIPEELNELDQADNDSERDWEGGDLLFAVINYLRMLKIDPESALNATTNRFIKRFLYVEKMSLEKGFELRPENMVLMEKYYQESKNYEESSGNKKLD